MKGLFNQWISSFEKVKQDPVTYFVHVPKTAGTSFIVVLDRFFKAEKIFPHQLWREIKQLNKKNNRHYDLYRGHLGGGGLDVLTDKPIDFLTILRNPVDLAQSTYEYVLREKNTKVHQLVTEEEMSFEEFLVHPMTQPLIKNRMVRNISFDFKQDPAAQEVFLSAETIEHLQSLVQKSKQNISEEKRLKRAIRFIEKSRWFGLLEHFDVSMQLLCFEMGWPPIGPTQKLNTFDHKPVLSDSTSGQLEAINQQDFKLYRVAEKLFQIRLQAMKTELELLRSHDRESIDDLLDVNYQRLKQRELLHSVKYDFSQILLGNQWHRRELMEPEAEYFRWTGPEAKSTVDFWLKPNDYQITIRIINAISIEVLDGLKVKLNDHELVWRTVDSDVVRVLEMHCAEAMIAANGLARLSFDTQAVMSHQSAFNSDDQRLVGVAVHWIQFKHA